MTPTIFMRLHVHGDRRESDLKALAAVYSEGLDKYGFFIVRLPDSDPRIELVEREMHRLSIPQRPNPLTSEKMDPIRDRNYEKYRYHAYDDSDFANAEYLWLNHLSGGKGGVLPEGGRDAEGRQRFVGSSLRANGRMLHSGPAEVLVWNDFRHELEAEGFVGLGFFPTTQVRIRWTGDTYTVHPHDPPPSRVVWELRPTIELPRMHKDVVRVPTAPNIPCGEQGPGMFENPGFDDCQLTYSRAAIASVPPFDLARSWEYAYPSGAPDSWCIIVSPRFYKFCKSKRIRGNFIPVKIVEGE
jgi:hypothetical protein